MKNESDLVVLRKLFSLYAKRNRSTIVYCVLATFFDGTKSYLPVMMSGVLVDYLVKGAAVEELLKTLIFWLAVIFAVNIMSNFMRQQFNARIENVMERQNLDMNEASMFIDYELLESAAFQEKKRRQEQITTHWGGIYWMLIWPLDNVLQGLFGTIAAVCVLAPMFFTAGKTGSWEFWLLSLGIVAVVAVYIRKMYVWLLKLNRIEKEEEDIISGLCRKSNYYRHAILFGAESGKDLRIFGQEKLVEEGACDREEEIAAHWSSICSANAEQAGKREALSSLGIGGVYLYAALCAYMGLISVGSVVRYAGSILQCVKDIATMMAGVGNLRNAALFGREYLDYVTVEHPLYQGTIPVEKRQDDRFLVKFEHVSFQYPGSENYVLRDLNLSLDIGERCAIVGRNGSGKTTFIKLLCRLYDVTEGTIKLNGIDIRKYNYEDYVRLFSVVFQDYRIFSLKAGENIAAGEDVDEERVWDALTRAGLQECFGELPQGLDTFVGKEFDESGINFSGGERQKMAIARAIYKAGAFVIMDEPTAALDPVSECEVYAGFDKMVGRKTAFYISHRLASCRFCQDILVFDEGKVVQRGSHEELVAQEGLYRELWEAQAQYYTM